MYTIRNGYVEVHYWQPYRAAVEAAMADLGIAKMDNGSIPTDVWNIGVATAVQYETQRRAKIKCVGCGKPVEQGDDIRCFDCRGLFCPACAKEHFWPNGRPQGDHHG